MVGSEYLSASVQIITIVMPVAVYFLILGLLNSRRHPQLVTGRRDFALLIVALSPLFVLPVLNYVGVSPASVAVAVAAVAMAIMVLAPLGKTWVIYNITLPEAQEAIAKTLRSLSVQADMQNKGFAIGGGNAFIEVSSFPILRNVSVRLRLVDKAMAKRFEAALAETIGGVEAQTNPTAVAMLLVATVMIVAPFTLLVNRAAEIVRVITDLLH